MPWKVDNYQAIVREVSEKKKPADENWRGSIGFKPYLFFDTREEAIAHKETQLKMEVERDEKNLRLSQDRLKRFRKKFNGEKPDAK